MPVLNQCGWHKSVAGKECLGYCILFAVLSPLLYLYFLASYVEPAEDLAKCVSLERYLCREE